MEYTHIEQECYGVTLSSGADEYRMETSVTAEGELPHTHVFVYRISNTEDPATDIFTRVASPQELQDVNISRDDAIDANEGSFLASSASLQYSALTVAVQAKAALRTRINQLIRNWIMYRDDFEYQSGATLIYPTVDPDLEATLRENYVEAKAATTAAEADVVVAEGALDDANITLDCSLNALAIYDAEVLFGSEFDAVLANYVSQVTDEGALATAYRSGTLQPALTAYNATAQASQTSMSNTVAAERKAVEDATTAKAEAESALAAAQTAEDAALAALREVCPTFDPASV